MMITRTRILGMAAALVLAMLVFAPVVVLTTLKIISAVVFATAVAGGAGWTLGRGVGHGAAIGRLARTVVLGAVAVVVLVRGAPHNNPAIYWMFEHQGVAGLMAAVGVVLGGGFLGGLWFARRGSLPQILTRMADPANLGRMIALFSALAALAALEQVRGAWDAPGWGDAIFWDRITQLIARGDLPTGHSYYMPLYQYGAAALYRLFGHAHAVQQVANVLWAPVTVIFLCLAARQVMASNWLVLLVGVVAASHDYLRYTPHVMQIENWYVPLLAIATWAALRCRHTTKPAAAALLGLTAALVFSTRSHAAFFDGLLLLAPLVFAATSWKDRLRATAIAIGVFTVLVTPWAARNAVVEGRFALTGTQGPTHMVMSADPRTFFGIRRNLGGQEVVAEWVRRYPDVAEREKAMSAYVLRTLVENPLRTLQGAGWRSLAFYGLLPDGVWAPEGPVATDWHATGKAWFLRNLSTLALLLAAGLGLLIRRDRLALFLLASVAASMAPVLVVGFTEARIHYPVLCLLILAAAAGLGRSADAMPRPSPRPGRMLAAGLTLAGLAALAYAGNGTGLYRPIMEPAITLGNAPPSGEPDRSADFLKAQAATGLHSPDGIRVGDRLRLTVAVTNHHLPVKWYAETVPLLSGLIF